MVILVNETVKNSSVSRVSFSCSLHGIFEIANPRADVDNKFNSLGLSCSKAAINALGMLELDWQKRRTFLNRNWREVGRSA